MGTMAQAFLEMKGNELWERTVGIVGLGAVGRGVAARLAPFEARILAYDPFVTAEQAGLPQVRMVSLEELLRESDIISLHAPVTDETTGMIGAAQLAMVKPGALFINTARPALVDEEALVQALRDKRLGGAAIDVFDPEPPPPDHPLLQFDNVIATPHIGGNTNQVVIHQSRIVTDDLVALFEGRAPRHVANPQTLPNWRWR